jgi:uncharacterized protein (UPF0333 family)
MLDILSLIILILTVVVLIYHIIYTRTSIELLKDKLEYYLELSKDTREISKDVTCALDNISEDLSSITGYIINRMKDECNNNNRLSEQ